MWQQYSITWYCWNHCRTLFHMSNYYALSKLLPNTLYCDVQLVWLSFFCRRQKEMFWSHQWWVWMEKSCMNIRLNVSFCVLLKKVSDINESVDFWLCLVLNDCGCSGSVCYGRRESWRNYISAASCLLWLRFLRFLPLWMNLVSHGCQSHDKIHEQVRFHSDIRYRRSQELC